MPTSHPARLDDRTRQCGMRIAFADRIEQRECAHEKVVSRRRQPRSEPDQALNGVLGTAWRARREHAGQPAFEGRDARAGDARQRRLMRRRFTNATDLARKAFFRRIDCGAPCQARRRSRSTGRRRTDGPGRRTPRFALVQGEPNGIADQDMPRRRPQPIARRSARSLKGPRFPINVSGPLPISGSPTQMNRRRSGDRNCVRKRLRRSRAQRCGRIPAPERPIAGSGR